MLQLAGSPLIICAHFDDALVDLCLSIAFYIRGLNVQLFHLRLGLLLELIHSPLSTFRDRTKLYRRLDPAFQLSYPLLPS